MNRIILSKVKQFEKLAVKFPELKYLGDKVLRQKTRNVLLKEGLEIGEKLGDMLVKYRKITGMGRGLAAPQIGISKSVFVTYVNDQVQIFINPEIVDRSSDENYYRELCLSCGVVWGDVKRPSKVTMKWMDENGQMRQEKMDGVIARLWQHEYDHLQGVVNLDRAEPGSIEFVTTNPLLEKLRDIK